MPTSLKDPQRIQFQNIPPQRILIVRLSHLGDAVCTLGLLDALHAAYPSAEIAWAIQPEFAGLLDGARGLDRVIPFHRHGLLLAWLRLRRDLHAFAPDWVIDAQGNLKSAAVTLLAGARRRSGMERADWRERRGFFVLNDPAPATRTAAQGGRAHLVKRMGTLIAHVTPSRNPAPPPDPRPTSSEIEAGHRRWKELGTEEDAPVVISLSAPEDIRAWPLTHWIALIEQLRRAGKQVVVISGPGELQLGEALERRLPGAPGLRHWVGQRGLRELVGFFGAGAERGARLIACDSGPMHLAWSSGMRVVLLAGPQDPGLTGPWPTAPGPEERGPHIIVRASPHPPCAPCLARRCSHPEGPVCMSGIDPAEVAHTLG